MRIFVTRFEYLYRMNIKSDRLEALREVIVNNDVRNQDEVLSLLESKGYNVTQATLSRDFKELGVVKVHEASLGYVYRLGGTDMRTVAPASAHLTKDGIRSIEFSNSFAVVKTHPGFAGAVASIIDNNITREIVGTIAGDDTVLLIVREGYTRMQVLDAVSRHFSGIQTKLK